MYKKIAHVSDKNENKSTLTGKIISSPTLPREAINRNKRLEDWPTMGLWVFNALIIAGLAHTHTHIAGKICWKKLRTKSFKVSVPFEKTHFLSPS